MTAPSTREGWRLLLAQKHAPNACPCRKHCESAPAQEIPKPPSDFAARHRIGDKRHERVAWLETVDLAHLPDGPGRDWAVAARALLDNTTPADVCHNCGRSLLLTNRGPCARCMSSAEIALAHEIAGIVV